jgi:hypothetical protein
MQNQNAADLSRSQHYIHGMRTTAFTIVLATSILALQPAEAKKHHVQSFQSKCSTTVVSKSGHCKITRFRKAIPQQEMLLPLYADPQDLLLVPPLQGVLNSDLGKVDLKARGE